MNNSHLSDEAIQLTIADPGFATHEQLSHLKLCPECAAKAANYAAIVGGLRELLNPVIGVHLQLAVMHRIAHQKTRSKSPAIATGLLAGLAVAAISALVWLNPELFRLTLSGLSADMFGLIVFTVLPVAIFFGLLTLRMHQKQMQLLENV